MGFQSGIGRVAVPKAPASERLALHLNLVCRLFLPRLAERPDGAGAAPAGRAGGQAPGAAGAWAQVPAQATLTLQVDSCVATTSCTRPAQESCAALLHLELLHLELLCRLPPPSLSSCMHGPLHL